MSVFVQTALIEEKWILCFMNFGWHLTNMKQIRFRPQTCVEDNNAKLISNPNFNVISLMHGQMNLCDRHEASAI
jgi:hypothetical protein